MCQILFGALNAMTRYSHRGLCLAVPSTQSCAISSNRNLLRARVVRAWHVRPIRFIVVHRGYLHDRDSLDGCKLVWGYLGRGFSLSVDRVLLVWQVTATNTVVLDGLIDTTSQVPSFGWSTDHCSHLEQRLTIAEWHSIFITDSFVWLIRLNLMTFLLLGRSTWGSYVFLGSGLHCFRDLAILGMFNSFFQSIWTTCRWNKATLEFNGYHSRQVSRWLARLSQIEQHLLRLLFLRQPRHRCGSTLFQNDCKLLCIRSYCLWLHFWQIMIGIMAVTAFWATFVFFLICRSNILRLLGVLLVDLWHRLTRDCSVGWLRGVIRVRMRVGRLRAKLSIGPQRRLGSGVIGLSNSFGLSLRRLNELVLVAWLDGLQFLCRALILKVSLLKRVAILVGWQSWRIVNFQIKMLLLLLQVSIHFRLLLMSFLLLKEGRMWNRLWLLIFVRFGLELFFLFLQLL